MSTDTPASEGRFDGRLYVDPAEQRSVLDSE